MAQSIEQINQSIRALEEQANQVGEQLYEAYRNYRSVVGQTALQQLVMACYTLCTEAYPEEFLALAVYQRNQLQAKIRQTAKQLQTDLLDQLPHPQAEIVEALPLEKSADKATNRFADRLSDKLLGGRVEMLDDREAEMIGDDDASEVHANRPHPDSRPHPNSIEAEVNSIEEELRALLSLEALMPAAAKSTKPKTAIEKLMRWQESVEDTTIELMRQTSRNLNLEFQQAGLIPAQIPAPILEAAAHTDGGDPFGKTPHLLRMVLEAREIHRDDGSGKGEEAAKRRRREDKRSSKPPTIVPIVAVQMRLVELEFNDTNLITCRNQIRDLSKQLKMLSKDYQKKQREQAVANARLAWQSTWTSD
jgi:hypothetical protein